MKRAIVSDVHGNLEALEAVFRDIDRRNDQGDKIQEVLCLGDVLGYGPNPIECIDLIRRRSALVLAGNHELGALEKIKNPRLGLNRTTGFGGMGAREGILWAIHQMFGDGTGVKSDDAYTRELVSGVSSDDYDQNLARDLIARFNLGSDFKLPLAQRLLKGDAAIAKELLEKLFRKEQFRGLLEVYARKVAARRQGEEWIRYLGSLPKASRVDDALLVHDNPFNPGDARYVLDGARSGRSGSSHSVERVFSEYEWKNTKFMFFGHSHFSGIYTDPKRPGVMLANPGSVGIPRGDKLEAAYLIWNPKSKIQRYVLRLVRIPLTTWQVTGRKMEQAGLPNKLKLVAEKTDKELD